MSIVATPQPDHVPPRVRIDIDSDDPTKPFTALTISRDGRPVREQPYVGGSEAVVFDYEAPFGVPVTYSATGATSSFTSVHTETWASLAGWTTIGDSPSVSGSRLGGGSVQRALAFPAEGRLVSQGLVVTTSGISDRAVLEIGPMTIENRPAGQGWFFYGSSRTLSGLDSPFTVTWDAASATVATVSGTWVVPRTSITSNSVLRARTESPGGGGVYVEDFVISSGSNAAFAATATTTLATTQAWLIHPSQPSLSCAIDNGPGGPSMSHFVEASSGESKTSAATSTTFRPVGRRKAVVVTSGPRHADDWTLVIGSRTTQAKNAIRDLVDDQTPLLLRSPAGIGWDLPDDWYSVGDVEVSRVTSPIINEMTLTTLPLTPVDEPIVRQGALWTWGDVMLKYATWADVLADNDTWLDVLIGPSA